jgi:hypothetical protein
MAHLQLQRRQRRSRISTAHDPSRDAYVHLPDAKTIGPPDPKEDFDEVV